eukprot:scaffold138791_cov121-Phaeocystis_antarctica.AAC.1
MPGPSAAAQARRSSLASAGSSRSFSWCSCHRMRRRRPLSCAIVTAARSPPSLLANPLDSWAYTMSQRVPFHSAASSLYERMCLGAQSTEIFGWRVRARRPPMGRGRKRVARELVAMPVVEVTAHARNNAKRLPQQE